jgi:hypothetical protein
MQKEGGFSRETEATNGMQFGVLHPALRTNSLLESGRGPFDDVPQKTRLLPD